ncbi:MAG: glutamine synthetase [Candidatus Bathyarchaeota archaeon]|nr:MAG: glutamine synthetase [Candidatus Bathyarchaeota archaeon]
MKQREQAIDRLIRSIEEQKVKVLSLCHIPEDGRLRALNFSASDKERLKDVLKFGERIDGSSVFSSIQPEKSDIYILPNIRNAFLNPFVSPLTLNVLCDYYDEDGFPLLIAPRSILARAEEKLRVSNKAELRTLVELEFYVVYRHDGSFLQTHPDKNYHQTTPFSKFEGFRNEVLLTLEEIGVATKYGHSEVGGGYNSNLAWEQHEIELLPQTPMETVKAITLAKWVIRNICARQGFSVSFSPKPFLEHAGNGMHLHICVLKNGKNVIKGSSEGLTDETKQIVGGLLEFAPSLTAFANPIPPSYLRFIKRKESPADISWGIRNRTTLIRIPLWSRNPHEAPSRNACRETIEFRGSDPTAKIYYLLAGIVLAVNYGLENPKASLQYANGVNVEKEPSERGKRVLLPRSCSEAATELDKRRELYEAMGVFPKGVITATIEELKSFNDSRLGKRLADEPSWVAGMIDRFFNFG